MHEPLLPNDVALHIARDLPTGELGPASPELVRSTIINRLHTVTVGSKDVERLVTAVSMLVEQSVADGAKVAAEYVHAQSLRVGDRVLLDPHDREGVVLALLDQPSPGNRSPLTREVRVGFADGTTCLLSPRVLRRA